MIGKLTIQSMESDPEKPDQKKSLWNEVKVTGVNFVSSILKAFPVSKNQSYAHIVIAKWRQIYFATAPSLNSSFDSVSKLLIF